MNEYFSSQTFFEILRLSLLIYVLSAAISHVIASIFFGADHDFHRWGNSKYTFKLIKPPHELKTIKLSLMMSPIVFIIIYFIFIKLKLY